MCPCVPSSAVSELDKSPGQVIRTAQTHLGRGKGRGHSATAGEPEHSGGWSVRALCGWLPGERQRGQGKAEVWRGGSKIARLPSPAQVRSARPRPLAATSLLQRVAASCRSKPFCSGGNFRPNDTGTLELGWRHLGWLWALLDTVPVPWSACCLLLVLCSRLHRIVQPDSSSSPGMLTCTPQPHMPCPHPARPASLELDKHSSPSMASQLFPTRQTHACPFGWRTLSPLISSLILVQTLRAPGKQLRTGGVTG